MTDLTLFYSRPSPYARKVLVTAHEKGLIDRLALREVDPWTDPPELLAATPLAKVPALATADGLVLADSTIITLHLDGIGPGRRLVEGDRVRVLARAALAQGLTDAAFATVVERRRPAERQWPAWLDRQRRAIERTLARVEPGEVFDLGDIGLACALAYLDFRLPEVRWRADRPALAAWLDRMAERPSMVATRP